MIKMSQKEAEALTEFHCSGELTIDEVKDAIEDFYRGTPTRNVIWELTAANISTIRAQDVRGVAIFAREAAHSRPGGKTALVGDKDTTFGISRMYQSFAELAGQESNIQIFRTRDEALAWVSESGQG